jgi:DNA-directed RNA polymerase specialized sigma24 family protein
VRVHRSLGTIDECRPLLPWLSKIAYRAALRRLRNVSEIVEPDVDALRSRGVEPANLESPEQLVVQGVVVRCVRWPCLCLLSTASMC